MRRAVAAVVLAAVVCGCGSARQPGESGRATLWITRDRGAHVLLVKKVAAGMSAMEALTRNAKVETRYGGRYVQSINGLAGSLDARRDWFYFVNGYEADRGAADYTLQAGDVEWWDYRSWAKEMRVPVVVGAFPEPFLHGYDGNRRPAVVVTTQRFAYAQPVARRLHARLLNAGDPIPKGANAFFLGPPLADARFEARTQSGDSAAGAPVRMLFIGHLDDLLAGRYRYRYQVRP
jgi:hypothetical protein